MNVSQVITAFGGYSSAQTLFGVSRSLLARWEEEGIPTKRWAQLVEVAKLKGVPGVTFESLSSVTPSKAKAAA